MIRDALFAAVVSLAVLLASCGSGSDEQGVDFFYGPNGVDQILKNGTNLAEGTAGYHIIGGCDGSDSAATNVTSSGSNGSTLFAPDPSCPGAPFQILIEQVSGNTIRSSVTIGPLPVRYATISVPLDLRARFSESFSTDVSPLFLGGCGDVRRVDANGGTFAQIPLACPAGVGGVGLADGRAPGTLLVIEGIGFRVTRRVLAGNHRAVHFYSNLPIDVRNSEVSFGAQPAGAVLTLAEEITVE